MTYMELLEIDPNTVKGVSLLLSLSCNEIPDGMYEDYRKGIISCGEIPCALCKAYRLFSEVKSEVK